MKDKTYRVKHHLSKEVCERNLDYIKKNGEILAEAKMLNAILAVGIEKAKDKDIEKYLKLNEEINQ